jgi:hypothetical protein
MMKKIATGCILAGLLVPFFATLCSMLQLFGQLTEPTDGAEAMSSTSAHIPALMWINSCGVLLVISGITLFVVSVIRSRQNKVARDSVQEK